MDWIKDIFNFKVLLVFLAIYLFYKLGKVRFNLHLKLGHKGPNPFPFLGNFTQLLKHGEFEFYKICRENYGKIYPLYYGNVKLAMVSDEELLKQIFIKNSKCFIDRFDLGFHGKTTEKMLSVSKGKDWERVRNLLTPTFTSGKLRKMSPLISDAVNLLIERMDNYPTDKPIDIKGFFGALTMDIIARTMFGMHIDTQNNPNNAFITNAKKIFKFKVIGPILALFVLLPEFAKLCRKCIPNWEVFDRSALQFFTKTVKRAIEERHKSDQTYNDFLNLMLNAHKDINENDPDQKNNFDNKSLTFQEIMAESIEFILAGYETTSITLTFLSYFLAKNPEYQEEIYNEIIEKIGIDGKISYESLMDLPILDAAINETLRICPPAPKIDRVCTQDVILKTSDNKNIMAKKGDNFTIPIYAIHTDPLIWEHPNTFDLHRFDPENKKNHKLYSFIPFGMGPRTCIGMRFALLEVKWAIVAVLQKFELVRCTETLEFMKFSKSGLATPIKPIILKIFKRH